MRFFVGLHHPADARHFDSAFISVNALRKRKGDFLANDWILDSGAFSLLSTTGAYPTYPDEYAAQILRWRNCGRLLAAVSQDYMCEPWIVAKTGLSVSEHQRLTIERYTMLIRLVHEVYIMPVLQGYAVAEYVQHLRDYGDRLALGAWVGVGSICKRNSNPATIEAIVVAIKAERPDLRLHGFGIKATALSVASVRDRLFSADSMAWSFAARYSGRNGNDWREARAYAEKIDKMPAQLDLYT